MLQLAQFKINLKIAIKLFNYSLYIFSKVKIISMPAAFQLNLSIPSANCLYKLTIQYTTGVNCFCHLTMC